MGCQLYESKLSQKNHILISGSSQLNQRELDHGLGMRYFCGNILSIITKLMQKYYLSPECDVEEASVLELICTSPSVGGSEGTGEEDWVI